MLNIVYFAVKKNVTYNYGQRMLCYFENNFENEVSERSELQRLLLDLKYQDL